MGEEDGLGPLKVRVDGNDRLDVPIRLPYQGPLELDQQGTDLKDLVTTVETEVHGHLIVPGASRVELASDRTNAADQFRLNVQMDIFLVDSPSKTALFNIAGDAVESFFDSLGVFCGQALPTGQHADMGDASADIIGP